jgi:hypothetical protein
MDLEMVRRRTRGKQRQDAGGRRKRRTHWYAMVRERAILGASRVLAQAGGVIASTASPFCPNDLVSGP